MAAQATITRRFALKAFPFFGAAVAAPLILTKEVSAISAPEQLPPEVVTAVFAWRDALDAANVQWDVYSVTKSRADYDKWQAFNSRVASANTEMNRALFKIARHSH